MLNGTLRGIVINTSRHHNVYKRFKFIKLNEFYQEEIKEPRFKKIKLFRTFRKSGDVDEILNFLTEISNLPICAWKYSFLTESRNVLIEKSFNYSHKHIFYKYATFNSRTELELIKIIANKYNRYNASVVENVFTSLITTNIINDAFEYGCTIRIPSFHNKTIYLELNTYQAMAPLYQMYIDKIFKQNISETEIEFLVNK